MDINFFIGVVASVDNGMFEYEIFDFDFID